MFFESEYRKKGFLSKAVSSTNDFSKVFGTSNWNYDSFVKGEYIELLYVNSWMLIIPQESQT